MWHSRARRVSAARIGVAEVQRSAQPHLADDRFFFFSSRRRHTRLLGDWSSDVCSSDLYGSCSWDGDSGDNRDCPRKTLTCRRSAENNRAAGLPKFKWNRGTEMANVEETIHKLKYPGAIDADGHILESAKCWEQYCEAKYKA